MTMDELEVHTFNVERQLVGTVYEGTFSRFNNRVICSCGKYRASIPDNMLHSEEQLLITQRMHQHMIQLLCEQLGVEFRLERK
jgi:hypothetical protein